MYSICKSVFKELRFAANKSNITAKNCGSVSKKTNKIFRFYFLKDNLRAYRSSSLSTSMPKKTEFTTEMRSTN